MILHGFLIILLLMCISAFFAMSEISLAASRRVKLRVLLDEGHTRAQDILSFQEQPGIFFTTVQIGLNAVAILAGIVGNAYLAPRVSEVMINYMSPAAANSVSTTASFGIVTLMFVFIADLMPKRIAMAMPEKVALCLIKPMKNLIWIFSPLTKLLNALADVFFKILGMPEKRQDDITSDDIYAVMEAGTMAGLLRNQEKELIGNVFELDTRTVPSAMTVRENVVFFDMHDSEETVKEKVSENPHSTYLVCNDVIDNVLGYVDSKDLLERLLKGQSLSLKDGLPIRPPLILPDTLTLAEAMDQFKGKGEDIAVVLNEYALVVGIISLKDIMVMLMGTLIGPEEQIMKRDEHSWLIEGATPIDDVMNAFDIDEFPESENYETIGGFMTYMLRRIPHRTDSIVYAGYKFEVMDIDNYKIDQILLSKVEPAKNDPKNTEDVTDKK